MKIYFANNILFASTSKFAKKKIPDYPTSLWVVIQPQVHGPLFDPELMHR